MSIPAMLSIKGLSKSYGDHQALDGIDMEIPKQSIFGLLGPNGAGKTSLIRIINQIITADEGQILFNGKPMQASNVQRIGYLPEERGLYPKMRVGEQLLYLAQLKGLEKSVAKDKIKYWLKHFELEAWQGKEIETLSKGMAQKVQFIATILHEPELLIFDEPFTGFDPINTDRIKAEIRKLRESGATIIFSTHRMESVEEICDEIALIHRSKKLLQGPIQSVKDAHKTGHYRVRLHQSELPPLPSECEILSEAKLAQGAGYRLAIPASQLPATLLALEKAGLRSFEEEEPSLNEIFIKTVQDS
jgi:ABC-2 type transport system ATP-binding protein